MKWLEVSISLSGELAEPVSDLFTRHSQGGVAIEAAASSNDLQVNNLVILRAYLPVDEELEDRQRSIEEGLWHLSQIQTLPQPQFQLVNEEDWEKAWKRHYHPIRIGKHLIVQPAWLPIDETERLAIIMDPGMAFGTGTHPTTQLCLEALEDYLQADKPVIDLGCGSGILSIAAAKLGASQVLALDIDPIAVENTRENSNRNDVSHIISAHQGSLDLLLADAPSDRVPASLVLGNIIAKTLEEMIRSGLGMTIRNDGTLILSGILDHQVNGIQTTCDEMGLVLIETRSIDDWRALVVKRKPPQ